MRVSEESDTNHKDLALPSALLLFFVLGKTHHVLLDLPVDEQQYDANSKPSRVQIASGVFKIDQKCWARK